MATAIRKSSTTGARKKLIAAQQQRSNELKLDAIIDQDEIDEEEDVDMETKNKPLVAKNPSSDQLAASNPFFRLFWDLSSEDAEARSQARDTLIETLKKEQHDLLLADPHPRDKLTHNTRYALKRLLRGLCASTASSRAGFADALSSLINTFYSDVLSLYDIQSARLKELCLPTKPSRQEQTHHKWGSIAYFRVVINTKLIQHFEFRDDILPLIETALDIGVSNRHVTEQAYESVIAACKQLTFEQFTETVEPKILSTLVGPVKMEDESESEAQSAQLELSSFTSEQLVLLFGMQSIYETNGQKASAAGKSLFDHQARHPFSPKSYPSLLIALNSSTKPLAKSSPMDSEYDDAPQQSSAESRVLNTAWKQALSSLIDSDQWQQFWVLCDDSMFGQRSTEARKITGFLIFHHLLFAFSKPDQVSFLFQSQFMRAFMTHLSSPRHKLYAQAQGAQKAIISKAELNPHLVSSILASLLDPERGSPRFDSITKSKTVQSLIAFLDQDSVIQYQKQLISTFHSSVAVSKSDESAESDVENRSSGIRMWVVDQMYSLCKNTISLTDSPASAHSDVLTTALIFFVFYSYFDSESATISDNKSKKKAGKQAKPAASNAEFVSNELLVSLCHPVSSLAPSVRQACHLRLWTLLNDLLPRPKAKTKNTAQSESGEGHDEADVSVTKSWAHRVLELCNTFASRGYVSLALSVGNSTTEVDPELLTESQEARETVLQMVDVIQKQQKPSTDGMDAAAIMHAKQDRVVALLMIHLALLSISEPESATPLLQEVQLGYASFKQTRDSGKTSSKKSVKADSDEEPVWIELIVDILLVLLVRPSSLFRDLSKLVFIPFSQYMNENALEDMLRVVGRKATDEMLKKKNGGEDESDEESDDDFEPFDIEGQDEKISKKHVKLTVDSDDSNADMSNDESTPAVKLSTQQLIKRKQSGSDSESESEDEMLDMESLESLLDMPLTEEEQAQVDAMRDQAPVASDDAHLSNIVRLRQQANKKQKKDLVEQTVHFQLRVLDLVETFARLQSSSPLIISPLLTRLIEVAHRTRTNARTRAFHTKLCALVKKVCKSKRTHPSVAFHPSASTNTSTACSIESVQSVMTELMERAQRTDVSDTLSLLSHAMLFLVRLSLPATFLVANDRSGAEWKDMRRVEHRDFVIRLYRTGFTAFLTVKRTFNTKFFQDFITAAPAMAFELIEDVANIAYTPLSMEELVPQVIGSNPPVSSIKGKKAKQVKSVAVVSVYSGPFALNGFLRSEAFTLIGHMFTHRAVIDRMDKDKVRSTVEAVSRATKSAIDYVVLDDDTKSQLRSAHSARDAKKDEPQQVVEIVDPTSLSKKELKAYKEKQKKRRRREREKEAQKAVKAANPTKSIEPSSDAVVHTEALRLKTIIKAANTTATQVKRLSDSSLLLSFNRVQESLALLPAAHANTLKSVVHNLCSSLQWAIPSAVANVQSTDMKQKKARRDTKIRAKTEQAKQVKQEKQERSAGQKRVRDAVIPLKANKKATKKEGSLDDEVEAQSNKKMITAATDKKPRKQGNQVKGQNMKDKVQTETETEKVVAPVNKAKRSAEGQTSERKTKRSKQ